MGERYLDDESQTEELEPLTNNQSVPSSPRALSPWKNGMHRKSSIEELREEDVGPQLRRSSRQRRPNPKYANVVLTEENNLREPVKFEEAFQNAKWRKAMEEEIMALEKNQTWCLVPKPNDVKLVSCKWVYKVKIRPDESIERYKARLVDRGFSQQYAFDCDETFSPIAKITTV